jgi:hypothetical protein
METCLVVRDRFWLMGDLVLVVANAAAVPGVPSASPGGLLVTEAN